MNPDKEWSEGREFEPHPGQIFSSILSLHFKQNVKNNPSNRIRTSDLRISATFSSTVLRSTNWAIKGYVHCFHMESHLSHKLWTSEKKNIAADGFDPSTSGLWAQHASTAPRCSSPLNNVWFIIKSKEKNKGWKKKLHWMKKKRSAQ